MTSISMADLIYPQTPSDFFHYTFGKMWSVGKVAPEHLAELCNWDTLNSLLSNQRLGYPRLRVSKSGKTLQPEQYTERIDGKWKTHYTRVVVDRLLGELRDGATLVIDRLDHAHPPVKQLSSTLEAELHASISVTLFASWQPVPGFNTHWDEQDIFTIQLSGRKHWKIFEPTRHWPLHIDTTEGDIPENPVAEFDTVTGDVLYLPHGWWHQVTATGEPSLHITVSILQDNGIDFITWLTNEARSQEFFRQRLPRHTTDEERQEYITKFRRQWQKILSDDNILDRFLAYSDGTSIGRPEFTFPNIALTNSVASQKGSHVILLVPRATITESGDEFILTALGRRWVFPSIAKPIIDLLLAPGEVSVGEVLTAAPGLPQERAAEVLFILQRAGVIALI